MEKNQSPICPHCRKDVFFQEVWVGPDGETYRQYFCPYCNHFIFTQEITTPEMKYQ
jgi:DNA-directed RNA polymerase subunit RPC12/RpoP